MSRAARAIGVLRPATVVAAGAVAVHQLRYAVGYGGEASGALRDHGHAYFEALIPILALLGGITVLATLVAALAGSTGTAARRSPALRALTYAAAIMVVFGAQETAEGILFAGHPGGVAAVAAHGGLVAIPLAVAFGWLVWLAVRGLEAVEERLATGPARADCRAPDRSARRPAWRALPASPTPAAAGSPPRAPPSV